MPITNALQKVRNPLAGNPGAFDSQGLEMPPEVVALITSLLMPGSGSFAKQLPQQMSQLGEAGAIFPEGEIPQILNKGMAQEFEQVAPATRVNYVRNNNLANFHAQNNDWPRVLADKWAMLKNHGGN
jgi:hypothetical protein